MNHTCKCNSQIVIEGDAEITLTAELFSHVTYDDLAGILSSRGLAPALDPIRYEIALVGVLSRLTAANILDDELNLVKGRG